MTFELPIPIKIALLIDLFLVWIETMLPATHAWLPLGQSEGLQLALLLLPALMVTQVVEIVREISKGIKSTIQKIREFLDLKK